MGAGACAPLCARGLEARFDSSGDGASAGACTGASGLTFGALAAACAVPAAPTSTSSSGAPTLIVSPAFANHFVARPATVERMSTVTLSVSKRAITWSTDTAPPSPTVSSARVPSVMLSATGGHTIVNDARRGRAAECRERREEEEDRQGAATAAGAAWERARDATLHTRS